MLGVLVAFLALAVAISMASGQPVWYWILMALLVIASIDLNDFVVDRQARSYSQIEGMPGAAKAVLDQLPRGWTLEEKPGVHQPEKPRRGLAYGWPSRCGR